MGLRGTYHTVFSGEGRGCGTARKLQSDAFAVSGVRDETWIDIVDMAALDREMVQCKRTGSRSQFRAGVGPLVPLESDRCLAFLKPALMVRANALHYAMRIRTLLCPQHYPLHRGGFFADYR